jgi:hypothetical protein
MHFCGIRMTTQSDAANFFCARVWRGSALTRGGGRRGGGRRGCFAREQKQSFCTGQLRADVGRLLCTREVVELCSPA